MATDERFVVEKNEESEPEQIESAGPAEDETETDPPADSPEVEEPESIENEKGAVENTNEETEA